MWTLSIESVALSCDSYDRMLKNCKKNHFKFSHVINHAILVKGGGGRGRACVNCIKPLTGGQGPMSQLAAALSRLRHAQTQHFPMPEKGPAMALESLVLLLSYY
jgi:hypothetical protein